MALANIEKTNWKTNANLKSSFSIFKLILTKILSVLKPFFSSGRFGDPNKTKNASMIRLSGRYSHINLKERKKPRNNKTITENHLNFYSVNSMFCVLQFPNLVVRKWEYEGKKWSALILDMAFLHQSLLLNITFIILFFLRIEIRCVCAREIKKKRGNAGWWKDKCQAHLQPSVFNDAVIGNWLNDLQEKQNWNPDLC